MSNILAIANKELKSYFVSPIAYVVVGLFAVLFGVFFVSSLSFLLRISLQAGMMQGAPPININEYMIRPLLGNTGVIMLFVLPMITMRSYAEEKRSGTIELLISSPLTDWQIILGKFLGAVCLFVLMLAVTGAVLFMRNRADSADEWYEEPANMVASQDRMFDGGPSGPPPTMRGSMKDGYEVIEYPEGSGSWYYRDHQTNNWMEWV